MCVCAGVQGWAGWWGSFGLIGAAEDNWSEMPATHFLWNIERWKKTEEGKQIFFHLKLKRNITLQRQQQQYSPPEFCSMKIQFTFQSLRLVAVLLHHMYSCLCMRLCFNSELWSVSIWLCFALHLYRLRTHVPHSSALIYAAGCWSDFSSVYESFWSLPLFESALMK